MIQLGLPIAHMLTFLSSPPVTMTRPDLWPSAKQLTGPPCATNSSVNYINNIQDQLVALSQYKHKYWKTILRTNF